MLIYFHLSAGEDFLGFPDDSIIFEVEELEKTLLLEILDDDLVENVEELTVSITPVAGNIPVAVTHSTTTISIIDNDGNNTFTCFFLCYLQTLAC